MKNKKDLLEKLRKDVNDLEMQLNHNHIYKIRKFITNTFIKAGLAVDYLLPYILASFIALYSSHAINVRPFERENIIRKANVFTVDTSTGFHSEKTSFDENYNNYGFQYSTGFYLNEYGLYERTIISYLVSRNIDLKDMEHLFTMTKEEIENTFQIINVETIQKSTLDDIDEMFLEDMLIIANYHEDDNIIRVEQQGIFNELGDFLCYLGFLIVSKNILKKIKKVVFKDKIHNCLNSKLKNNEFVKYNIDEIRQILEIRKENLTLLEENLITESSDDSLGYTYKLGRNR